MKYRASSPALGSALACGANNAKIATGANISQREVRATLVRLNYWRNKICAIPQTADTCNHFTIVCAVNPLTLITVRIGFQKLSLNNSDIRDHTISDLRKVLRYLGHILNLM
jgi:hypothetical protein